MEKWRELQNLKTEMEMLIFFLQMLLIVIFQILAPLMC